MSATPWGELMMAALRMGIPPEMFWRLSLREWRLMSAASGAAHGLLRTEFEAMAERFPDTGARQEIGNGEEP